MTVARALRTALISLCLSAMPGIGHAQEAVLAFHRYPGWAPLRQIEDDRIDLREMASQRAAAEAYRTGAADLLAIDLVGLLSLLAKDDATPETVILFPTSISAGADFVIGMAGPDATNLAARRIGLERRSVSHYLLMRELDTFSHEDDRAPVIIDFPPEEIAAALLSARIDVAVIRAPDPADLIAEPGMALIFDSRAIGRDIVDLVVMRRDRYEADPDLAIRLTRAWFDRVGPGRGAVEPGISRHTIDTVDGARQMMTTGEFMFSMLRALDFVKLQHGDLRGTTSLNPFAIRFADGTLLGDPENVRAEVRFDHFQPPAP